MTSCTGCASHRATIESNVKLINEQKAALNRLKEKCTKLSDEAREKQDKLDELEMRLGLSEMKDLGI